MWLNERTLTAIAVAICGDMPVGKHFPYRSSSRLTQFFHNAGMNYCHDGSTRKYWVLDILKKLDLEPPSMPDLPSDSLVAVMTELFDPENFDDVEDVDREAALNDFNAAIKRSGLVGYFDGTAGFQLRNDGTGTTSVMRPGPRPLTSDEQAQRSRLARYLDSASEDDFTERVLVPFFQRMGFHRVTAGAHKEKILEFGKDLWMKFQLPTGHWLYFCAQIKRVKIDAKGVSEGNVAEVLNQAKMAIDHPIFDPDANRTVLLDHIFIISAAEITRQARQWLVEKLDKEQRRHIIFMDRDEFLNHAARISVDLPADPSSSTV